MGAESSISLTFTSLTHAQAAAILAAANAGNAPVNAPAPVVEQAAPANPTPAPVATAPVAPGATPAPAPAPVATSPIASITLQNIVEAARAFATAPGKGGAAKLKEILGQFGAAKATEVAPEKYAELHAALTA